METLINFRDLGGIKTIDGTIVKHHQFLRSGQLSNLSDEDKKKLANVYKLKKIYDFRSDKEVSQSLDDVIEGAEYKHLDILGDGVSQGAGVEDLLNPKYSPNDSMINIYSQLVLSEVAQNNYSRFLKSFIDKPHKCTLFHCYAGKDRTGFGAALILSSLNVSRKNIFVDYLKTNELRKTANEVIIKELEKKGASEQELDQIRIMLTVKKEYLEHSFDIVEQNFGSVSEYFTDVLRLPQDFEKKMQVLYTN